MAEPGDSRTDRSDRIGEFPAPELPYEPSDPKQYRPSIGLIGCGAITVEHLSAYQNAGYQVVGLCDLNEANALARQQEFYPEATIYTDFRKLLARDDIEVVDIATHPPQRPRLVEAAIDAGKHVLSQKPFVLDLDEGERLVERADRRGVRLAVNQNGRWAPHFSYLVQAVRQGLIGTVTGAHFAVHWDHSWVKGTEFENVRHLILYDFAIHWFDILVCLMNANAAQSAGTASPTRVFASIGRAAEQTVRPALLGQALVEFPAAQATLVFGGYTKFGSSDRSCVTGSGGTIVCRGADLHKQKITISTAEGEAHPKLKGDWFPDGFHGTMGELLCAIEENREPSHSARNNLESLALCFAAVASAERHEPVIPGSVRKMPTT